MTDPVFISYSHQRDRNYVDRLAALVAGSGLTVWFDKELITGDRWEHTIRSQIDRCAAVVVIMTPEAEQSDWVTREIHRAEAKAKPILPLLLRGEVFFRLSNIHFEDVTTGHMPGPEFISALRRLTNPPTTHAGDGHAHAEDRPAPPGMPPLVADFVASEISRISTYLRLIAQFDDLVYEGEDRDWLLGLTRAVRRTMDATSLVLRDTGPNANLDIDFWVSDLGRQYLEAQREAIQRGVRIRRLFILDHPDLRNDSKLSTLIQTQCAVGIEVRTLHPSELTATGSTPSLPDLIIFDDVLSYHTATTGDRTEILTTTVVTDHNRVAQRITQYQQLWQPARQSALRW